jgi:hypothetical protein
MPELSGHTRLPHQSAASAQLDIEPGFSRRPVSKYYPPNPVREPRLAHLRRSFRDGIWLNQSYIVFDRFYETVHSAAEHLFRSAERVAFHGMKRYVRRHGERIWVHHDIHYNGTALVCESFG